MLPLLLLLLASVVSRLIRYHDSFGLLPLSCGVRLMARISFKLASKCHCLCTQVVIGWRPLEKWRLRHIPGVHLDGMLVACPAVCRRSAAGCCSACTVSAWVCGAACRAGPMGWPFIGNLNSILTEDLPLYLKRLGQLHGPIFKVRACLRGFSLAAPCLCVQPCTTPCMLPASACRYGLATTHSLSSTTLSCPGTVSMLCASLTLRQARPASRVLLT